MNRDVAGSYRCPYTGQPLSLRADAEDGPDVVSGLLTAEGGREYPIKDGLPYLISPTDELFDAEERRSNTYYQGASEQYDRAMDWLFQSFHEDETSLRTRMVDLLELTPGSHVLETGGGTCRDSIHIAKRLGPEGRLYSQDLSSAMLTIGRRRMRRLAAEGAVRCPTEFFVGNAVSLPFADRSLDAAFHFGGLNVFSDKKKAIAEMARVVRVGGKVVVGDEGVAPWLRGSLYSNILINSNSLYQHTVPFECVPECARDVSVRWVLGNAFYLIEFRVGEGPPPLDLDLPILGKRGGTHRTRYFGALEGVTPEAKQLAVKAAEAAGVSLHAWLEEAVRRQALQTGGGRC